MKSLGINKTYFKLDVQEDWFKKGDILNTITYKQVRVIKVYNGWWRKVLSFLGFKVKLFDGILVKEIK